MPDVDAATFLSVLKVFRPLLTQPGWDNLCVLMSGWVLATQRHTITEALVSCGIAGHRHHEAFHRFFSRGTWSPDAFGRALLTRLAKWAGPVLFFAIDDTLLPHRGPMIFGIGSHLDAVLSTKGRRVFRFGHNWVVLSLVIFVPFSSRPWAVPILWRLYRTQKTCTADTEHSKKTELARELVDLVCRWLPDATLHFAGDNAYSNATLLRGLPRRAIWIGAMRPDAVLSSPTRRDPRSGKAERMPTPAALAQDTAIPWQTQDLELYGRGTSTVRYKTMRALWARAADATELSIVVVQCANGKIPWRVFFSTSADWTVDQVLVGYSRRWTIETFFRACKQSLGLSQCAVRLRNAVERVAPFVGCLYASLVLWALDNQLQEDASVFGYRPWYDKRNLSFDDILQAARRDLKHVDFAQKFGRINNLRWTQSAPENDNQLSLPLVG